MSALSSPERPRLLTTSDVAERLEVSERTVLRLVRRDRLPAIRFAERGPLRFRDEDVAALLEPRRGAA